jgi:hypothetical protein
MKKFSLSNLASQIEKNQYNLDDIDITSFPEIIKDKINRPIINYYTSDWYNIKFDKYKNWYDDFECVWGGFSYADKLNDKLPLQAGYLYGLGYGRSFMDTFQFIVSDIPEIFLPFLKITPIFDLPPSVNIHGAFQYNGIHYADGFLRITSGDTLIYDGFNTETAFVQSRELDETFSYNYENFIFGMDNKLVIPAYYKYSKRLYNITYTNDTYPYQNITTWLYGWKSLKEKIGDDYYYYIGTMYGYGDKANGIIDSYDFETGVLIAYCSLMKEVDGTITNDILISENNKITFNSSSTLTTIQTYFIAGSIAVSPIDNDSIVLTNNYICFFDEELRYYIYPPTYTESQNYEDIAYIEYNPSPFPFIEKSVCKPSYNYPIFWRFVQQENTYRIMLDNFMITASVPATVPITLSERTLYIAQSFDAKVQFRVTILNPFYYFNINTYKKFV